MTDGEAQEHSISTSEAPAEFVAAVRDALGHLYDYAHLECHPLCELVASSSPSLRDPSRGLRNLLLDALEQINPGPRAPRNSREWRPYGILVRRYVNGFSIQAIMDELHISLRQFHRDHRKGLLAVATHLWRQSQPKGQNGSVADLGETMAGLEHEVQSLGLDLRSVNLGAVVSELMGPLGALARGHGVRLGYAPPRRQMMAWADVTLARQAVLGALTATIVSRPANLELGWLHRARRVILDLWAWPLTTEPFMMPERRERLAVVEELMRAQGGDLKLGATQPERVRVRLSFRSASSTRVLLIDDNTRLLELYRRFLEAEGFAVTCAADSVAALEAAAQEVPDVIVLDVLMRDLDGWQMLEQIRSRPGLGKVPVIICSVLNEPEMAFVMGAQRYLKKPVSQEQLLAALSETVDGSSQEGTP
ncbi:MAG: response regulator [Anaerolineae bacterium]|nr:response regulator [Anaerolineae bacterium]